MPTNLNLPALKFVQQQLHFADWNVNQLAAQFATPLFVYSAAEIRHQIRSYQAGIGGFDCQIRYAVKANSNLALLKLIKNADCGFDIVSGGELQRLLVIGAEPKKIVFSGVGKTTAEIELALMAGIGCFNVESIGELQQISRLAQRLDRIAPISIRINPDVDAKTHPYISTGLKNNKFGIAHEDCVKSYLLARQLPNLAIIGIDAHIGSQITELEPFLAAVDKVLQLVAQLEAQQISLQHLDFGGGLGICYDQEQPVSATELVTAVLARVQAFAPNKYRVLFEPGRSIVGNAGICVTKVLYTKPQNNGNNFLIVDAAMNDLPRPAMYQAHHQLIPTLIQADLKAVSYNVVGPICESGDFIAHNRSLAVKPGDYLVVASAGAYCTSMASNYNTRNRAAEILLLDSTVKLIRQRESFADLIANEYYDFEL